MANDRSFFSYLLDSVLPRGGYVVSFATVYIDESGSHEGSAVLCLAGFVYEREHAALVDQEWRAILDRENLPYMRMSLFKDGRKPFDHLSRDRRIEIEKEFIAVVNRHKTLAFISAVNEDMYVRNSRIYGEPVAFPGQYQKSTYAFCLMDCLKMIRTWAQLNSFTGKFAYFFEAGHKDQSHANEIMNNIFFNIPNARETLQYASHTFADKREALPLQSADMLAWLAGNWFKKRLVDGRNDMRKDLHALLSSYTPRQRNSIHQYDEGTLIALLKEKAKLVEPFGWKFTFSSEQSS